MARRSLGTKIMGVAVGLSVLFAPEVAVAHEFDENTEISIQSSRSRLRRGRFLTISGRVRAVNQECFAGREVTLVSRRPKTTTTDGSGNYSFTFRPRRTRNYVAHVDSAVFGPHPHRHACYGDASEQITVKVRRKRR